MNKSSIIKDIHFESHSDSLEALNRLENVAIYIIAFAAGRGFLNSHPAPIKAMYDYKGLLSIVWSSLNAKITLAPVSCDAWELVGREPRINVHHEIKGQKGWLW